MNFYDLEPICHSSLRTLSRSWCELPILSRCAGCRCLFRLRGLHSQGPALTTTPTATLTPAVAAGRATLADRRRKRTGGGCEWRQRTRWPGDKKIHISLDLIIYALFYVYMVQFFTAFFVTADIFSTLHLTPFCSSFFPFFCLQVASDARASKWRGVLSGVVAGPRLAAAVLAGKCYYMRDAEGVMCNTYT